MTSAVVAEIAGHPYDTCECQFCRARRKKRDIVLWKPIKT